MFPVTRKIWTYQLNAGSITIDESYALTNLSFVLTVGTGSFQGSASANGVPSAVVPLVIGQAVSIGSDSPNFLDNFTITTTGSVAIIGK
jgi:hypothetical protein